MKYNILEILILEAKPECRVIESERDDILKKLGTSGYWDTGDWEGE